MTSPVIGVDERLVQDKLLFTIGEGSIDPATRIQNGEITEEAIDRLADDLRGDEYYETVDALAVPRACVDSRTLRVGPCAAGGTFSIVMGDALTTQKYRHESETAPQHATRYYEQLQQIGQQIGGHDDEHQHGNNCGCGAQDRLDSQDPSQASILGFLTQKSDKVRSVVELLGIAVSDELHAAITDRAAQLHEEQYATNGSDLRNTYVNVAGTESVETVYGVHNEVVAVINTQQGSSINHTKLRESYGEKLNAFNLDIENLRAGTTLLSLTPEEANNQFIGALYYNIATMAVLAGPSIRVVVR